MQYANGSDTANGQPPLMNGLAEHSSPLPAHAPTSQRPKRIKVGRMTTAIFANPTAWGEMTWKIEQYRAKGYGADERRFTGCYFEDLQDAMRGYYQARRWIKQVERRQRGRWFGWW